MKSVYVKDSSPYYITVKLSSMYVYIDIDL